MQMRWWWWWWWCGIAFVNVMWERELGGQKINLNHNGSVLGCIRVTGGRAGYCGTTVPPPVVTESMGMGSKVEEVGVLGEMGIKCM